MSVVYLLHFSEPYYHAQHYIGFANDDDADRRLGEHLHGDGSPLVRTVAMRGIIVTVVRVWSDATRTFERKLKIGPHGRKLCPICTGSHASQLPLPFYPPVVTSSSLRTAIQKTVDKRLR